jgi:hypothetical protein
VLPSAAIAAWLAFIDSAPRLVSPASVIARIMPFGFPFRITSSTSQGGPALNAAVRWLTRSDESEGIGKKQCSNGSTSVKKTGGPLRPQQSRPIQPLGLLTHLEPAGTTLVSSALIPARSQRVIWNAWQWLRDLPP